MRDALLHFDGQRYNLIAWRVMPNHPCGRASAVRVDGESLVVATYGEWDSRVEGGAQMKLIAIVPAGLEIEQRKGLSGPDSAGREWHERYLTTPKDAQEGYWYGPASPAEGWNAVPAIPDEERSAGK